MNEINIYENPVNNNNSSRKFSISKKLAYLIGAALLIIYICSLALVYFLKNPKSLVVDNSFEVVLSTQSDLNILQNINKNLNGVKKNHSDNKDVRNAEIDTNYRLPNDLAPFYYDLTIQPHFVPTQRPTFYNASIKIYFKCLNQTSRLVMHMKELTIDNETLTLKSLDDDSFVTVKNFAWRYDEKTSLFIVDLNQSFVPNKQYLFTASFRGYPKDDNLGFYRSSYFDSNSMRRWLITSQLEAIEARRSFLCFDEPGFKAKFKIAVIHDTSLTSMSNMPVNYTRHLGVSDGYNWTLTQFEPTVVMSTYLVAVVVSDFKCKKSIATPMLSKNVSVEVCTRPNAMEQLDYGLNMSVKLIEYFEELYKIKYPLPKLDHVAVPTFRYGAMENFGLAIYLERNFLLAINKTSQSNEQLIVKIISHEISHQWFGNLVTPKWWDDLWLNEGFAKYMESVGMNKMRPEWRTIDQSVSFILTIIEIDSSGSTRPISMKINTPQEIQTNIDPIITYGKGSSIIRMLSYAIGENTFNRGITRYLDKYKYQNVDQFDLWNTLQQQAGDENKLKDVNLTNVMLSWTRQKGHPIVQVKMINSTHISLKQKLFTLDLQTAGQINGPNKWYVPFTYSIENYGSNQSYTNLVDTNNLYDKIVWLKPDKDEVIIRVNDELDNYNQKFIIANLDTAGFYRVNYDEQNWKLIMKQLMYNKDQLSVRTRAQLISDIFSLTRGMHLNAEMALEFSKYMVNEVDYLPWAVFINRIKYFTDLLDSTEINGYLMDYMIELVRPVYSKLGWEPKPDDSWTDGLIRPFILRFACEVELVDCVNRAKEHFFEWKNENTLENMPMSHRQFIICTSIKHGSTKDFEFALEQYTKESDFYLKRDILYGLSCTKESWLLSKYLKGLLNSTSELIEALKYVSLKSNLLAWDFLKNNFEKIFMGSPSLNLFNLVFKEITKKISSQQILEEFENLIKDKPNFMGQIPDPTYIKLGIEANLKWFDKNYENLKQWFIKKNEKNSVTIDNYRLPVNIRPVYYELTIRAYVGSRDEWQDKSFTFDGQVNIYLTCNSPTNRIVLHSKELKVEYLNFRSLTDNVEDREVKADPKFEHDDERDFLIVNLNKNCRKDSQYVLGLKFNGKISERLNGFYISSYRDSNNSQHFLATTQFQPTHARRAFPCFDEPAFKAEFQLTIIRPKIFKSFSNNPIIRTENFKEDENWEIDYYDKTVPMSTYLVAYVISDFKSVSAVSRKGILVEVAGRPEAIDDGHGQYALTEATKIIDFFVDYYNVSYPLMKSTQIAIPDFSEGAMENWGLITYRESYLLFNSKVDNINLKKRISIFISHELSHQWFGNLVTLKFWDDLWLNEGFATWTEYIGSNFSNPEWRDLDNFYVESISTMVVDSLISSHPIKATVINPNEISSLFDLISYTKGASIIRMMNAFLTLNTFKNGITKYLNHYSYSNAEQDDLWKFLTSEAYYDKRLDNTLDVKSIMDTWTIQKGYPIVSIHKINQSKVSLKQEWFLLNPNFKLQYTEEYHKYKWYVPFTYTTKEQLNFDFETVPRWLKPEEDELIIELPEATFGSDSWIIGNLQHSGFYRVNYDQHNWNLLIKQLMDDYTPIHPINRAQLLDDAFNLGRADMIDQLLFLNMSQYLINESDSLPFMAAFYGLEYITDMLEVDYYAARLFKNYYMSLLENKYETINWDEPESDSNDISFQHTIVKTMCSYGSEKCIEKVKSYRIEQNSSAYWSIPLQYKKTIVQTLAKHSSSSTWFYLFNMAKNTLSYSERIDLIYSLCETNDINLLKLILKISSDQNMVKKQDEIIVLMNIAANPVGTKLIFDYVEENWETLYERQGISFMMFKFIEILTKNFNSKNELNRVRRFRDRNVDNQSIYDALNKAIENIKINIHWRSRNFEKINQWLFNVVTHNDKLNFKNQKFTLLI